jgi:transcription elongation factor GreB
VSKAFTSEETPEPISPTREPPRLGPGEIRYVTPEGHAALREELERLRLPGALPDEEGRRAQSLAEEPRSALGSPGGRAALLERTLAALTVLDPARVPEGEVGFGTWVVVEDEQGGRATWRIVGPDEADARRGSVSALSPVGQALLGRREGETVEVQRPGGVREYTILEVHRAAPKG